MIGEVQVRQEVLLGVLDHFKRNTVQKLFSYPIVLGGIQGRISQGTVVFEKVFEVPPKLDPTSQAILSPVDEDYLAHKLELEKQVNSDIDLVGFYICGPQTLPADSADSKSTIISLPELSQAFEAFKKKSELLFGAVFDTSRAIGKETGLPLLVVESTANEGPKPTGTSGESTKEHSFRRIPHTIADYEIINLVGISLDDKLLQTSPRSCASTTFCEKWQATPPVRAVTPRECGPATPNYCTNNYRR